jgi:predicted component of viral defense system (DUF524 family)
MTILYYDNIDRVAISDDPFFPDEEGATWSASFDGGVVPIDEWNAYYVKAYGKKDTGFLTAPPFYGKPFHGRVFEINFRNYVGLSRIGNINLRVQNKKISDTLYDSMLGYITDKYADLIFSFNTSVGLEYQKGEAGQDILYIQFLFLKKYLLDSTPSLDEITGLISARPHRKIETETRKCLIDEIDHFDVSLVLALFSDPGKMAVLGPGHPLLSSPLARLIHERTGKNHYPSEAMKIRKYHTFDTNENRFVKHFLQEISKRLDSIETALGGRSGSYLNPDILSSTRVLKQKVRYFLADPMWADVGWMNFVPAQSTVLQRRDGYRHLFRLYSLLQLITRYQFQIKDFRSLIEIKDVPTLFEYWCFFLVKDIIERKLKQKGLSTIVPYSETEQVVREGVGIEYEDNITLLYNASFHGSAGVDPEHTDISGYQTSGSYSHILRPDIVITKNNKTKLILDAKYKGKNGDVGFYGDEKNGSIISYKKEDLDKMHAYRDALKDVFGAFALYPGNEMVIYPSHQADNPFQGVGALPLKPVSGGKPNPEHFANLTKAIEDFIGY